MNRQPVRRLAVNRPVPHAPLPDRSLPGPLLLDLLAAVLEAGAPPPSALHAVAGALEVSGDVRAQGLRITAGRLSDPVALVRQRPERYAPHAPPGDPLMADLEEELLLAIRSGLAPTALIRRAAAESRRKQAAAQLKAVRRMEVMLVVPAGVCLLPAFVLLGVVPLVIGLFRG